jgi:hypothetical protein
MRSSPSNAEEAKRISKYRVPRRGGKVGKGAEEKLEVGGMRTQSCQGVIKVIDVLRQAERGERNMKTERDEKLHFRRAFMMQDMIDRKESPAALGRVCWTPEKSRLERQSLGPRIFAAPFDRESRHRSVTRDRQGTVSTLITNCCLDDVHIPLYIKHNPFGTGCLDFFPPLSALLTCASKCCTAVTGK